MNKVRMEIHDDAIILNYAGESITIKSGHPLYHALLEGKRMRLPPPADDPVTKFYNGIFTNG